MLTVLPPQLKELLTPQRLLLGPGPANVSARVQQAAGMPLLGHLDPIYLGLMDEVQEALRYVFQTSNRLTLAVPGAGSAGMEAVLCSLMESGDRVVVGSCGYFGGRLAEVARRCGADVQVVEGEWGKPLDPEALRAACEQHHPKLLAAVHGETSTGVLQPVEPLVAVAHDAGALLVLDSVTTLGGSPLLVDGWGVDAAYGGAQKCIGAFPGLAPVTLSERAVAAMRQRKQPVQSFYLDLSLLQQYWSSGRIYHHTAPATLTYALLEALRIIVGEGLEARWERHKRVGAAFRAGIRALGLSVLVADDRHLPQLTTVCIPEGIDDGAVRRGLLTDWNIEIGGGLGPLRGKVWRVGLMGASCTSANALTLLTALGQVLRTLGAHVDLGAAVPAALDVLAVHSRG